MPCPRSADSSRSKFKVKMACPYHHRRWRGVIQSLLNKLRGTLFQNRHIRNFPKAVCTCKAKDKKGTATSAITLCSIEDLKEWVDGPCKSNERIKKEAWFTLRYLVYKAAEDSSLDADTRNGLIGVLSVVKAASSGDFSALERSQKQEAIEPLLLKEEMELPLSSGYFGVFLGSGGKHIKPLCSKHGVALHFGDRSSQSGSRTPYRRRCYISGDSVKVSIKYTPESGADIKTVKDILHKRAELVTKQRSQHEANVKAWWELRSKRRAARREQGQAKALGRINQNPKEAATSMYERKHQRASKKRTNSTGSDQDPVEVLSGDQTQTGKKQPHPKSKVLNEGHCLNCMAEYRPHETNEGACTYHGGYLVPVKPGKENKGYSWTCCKKTTATQHPTHDLHSQTGCTNGRHAWRPGKSSSKGHKGGAVTKGKESAADTSDFYVK